MSKQDKIVKNAVNWISKIRPEYQVTELTASMQRVVLNHANAIQTLAFTGSLAIVGTCLGFIYMDKRMDERMDNLRSEMKREDANVKHEMYDEILKCYNKH